MGSVHMSAVLAGEDISRRSSTNRIERRTAERAERLRLRQRIVSVDEAAR